MASFDRDSLLPAETSVDRVSLLAARPAWDLRFALAAVLVAIVAAVTLVPASRASAAAAQGGAVPAPSGGAAAVVVQGLRIFVADQGSATLPAPETVLVADDR